MKLKILILIAIICFQINKGYSQEDHLLPMEGIFGIFNFQVEYYSEVRKILFEGLEEMPSFRIIVLPSFSEEYLITTKEKDGKFSLLLRKPNKNIWYSMQEGKTKLKSIEIEDFEIQIDSLSKDIFFNAFDCALTETKYADHHLLGLDGTTYIFQTVKYGRGKRTGHTWSPPSKSKMGKLVEVVESLTKSLQKEKVNQFEEAKNKAQVLIQEFKKIKTETN